MNLNGVIELKSEIVASVAKQDKRFAPIHSGAHSHFTALGYQHTGNSTRGGVPQSNYFRRKGGNSHQVSVNGKGLYIKTARTPKGIRKTKGQIDAKGMKCAMKVKPFPAAQKKAPMVKQPMHAKNAPFSKPYECAKCGNKGDRYSGVCEKCGEHVEVK